MDNMRSELIAPCGMNCRLCMAFQRKKNKCIGCNSDDCTKPAYCLHCIIKNCVTIQNSSSGLCYECDKFPCRRLKQLDKRYRTKYFGKTHRRVCQSSLRRDAFKKTGEISSISLKRNNLGSGKERIEIYIQS